MEHNSMQNSSYSIFHFPNSNQNKILILGHKESLRLEQLFAPKLSGIQCIFQLRREFREIYSVIELTFIWFNISKNVEFSLHLMIFYDG